MFSATSKKKRYFFHLNADISIDGSTSMHVEITFHAFFIHVCVLGKCTSISWFKSELSTFLLLHVHFKLFFTYLYYISDPYRIRDSGYITTFYLHAAGMYTQKTNSIIKVSKILFKKKHTHTTYTRTQHKTEIKMNKNKTQPPKKTRQDFEPPSNLPPTPSHHPTATTLRPPPGCRGQRIRPCPAHGNLGLETLNCSLTKKKTHTERLRMSRPRFKDI